MLPSTVEPEVPFTLGVDWSERASPISHCWLNYQSKSSSSASLCTYSLCTIAHPLNSTNCFQCGSCDILIHEEHMTHHKEMRDLYDCIPSCRPSFTDDVTHDYRTESNPHCWSSVPTLQKACVLCKRKATPRRTAFDNVRLALTTTNFPISTNVQETQVSESIRQDHSERSNALLCLWCSEYCHRWCYESGISSNVHDQCSYGRFKNIIVRPQWLYRTRGDVRTFHARLPNNFNDLDSSLTPLIIFVNKLSGGQEGQTIYRRLIRILNPRQVFLLENNETIKRALDIYASLKNTRICVCGGDGSVGWVLSILADTFSCLNNPPVAVCPIGTGNDLSRVLGWGWYYSMKQLLKMLQQIPNATPIVLDRWQISLEPLTLNDENGNNQHAHGCLSCCIDQPKFVRETDPPSYENYRTPLNTRFTNYLSFGLDPAVVLDFHDRRMRNPERFTSPFKNKLLYLNVSRTYFKEFVLWKAWDLRPYMRLFCDGENFSDSIRHCHSIVLLNIPSYGSGTRPWSKRPLMGKRPSTHVQNDECTDTEPINSDAMKNVDPTNHTNDGDVRDEEYASHNRESNNVSMGRRTFQRQNISDGKIEVFGLDSIEMAFIHVGLRGKRIAQGSQVRIELTHPMPVHMDGEPFYLPALTAITIGHSGQVVMLRKEHQ